MQVGGGSSEGVAYLRAGAQEYQRVPKWTLQRGDSICNTLLVRILVNELASKKLFIYSYTTSSKTHNQQIILIIHTENSTYIQTRY